MVRRLYDAGFGEDKAWNAWFFDDVYRDEDAMLLAPGGNPVSCLLLQRYDFAYPGGRVPMGYICGATTLASSRSRGYMSELMRLALAEAHGRGDVFVSLIPAERRLYNYYDRFGFATVVYNDIQRYTSLHSFAVTEGYRYIEPDYEAFAELERTRAASVLHDEDDFRAILDDLRHDRGVVSFVADGEGRPAAMAFAVPGRIENHVREILYTDEAAAEMALADITSRLDNGLPLEVWCTPTGATGSLRTRYDAYSQCRGCIGTHRRGFSTGRSGYPCA